ncbi:MAG: outer membrane protein assembly factor [Deltaproteobacteria bacterium]
MAGIDLRLRRGSRAGILALLLIFSAGAGIAGEEDGGSGPPVLSGVTFQIASPYRISYGELTGLVTLKAGDPLTPEAVRESIRRLYAKSVFRNISAYVKREGNKALLLFDLHPSPPVSEVRVVGTDRVPAASILSALRIRKGTSLETLDLSGVEETVRDLLRGKGFPDSTVRVIAACDADTGAGSIRIEIAEGSPGILRRIDLEGVSRFSPERARELLGLEPGDPYDFRDAEKGIRALRAAYKRAGYLTVHISGLELSCETGDGICLRGRVEEGPPYEVVWEGAREFSPSRLEKAVRLYGGEEEFTEGGLEFDVRERLLEFYRERDYRKAEVGVEAGEAGGEKRILRIGIREGKAGYLKEIRFTGNRSFSAKTLRKQMLSRERGVFHLLTGSGTFEEADWNADLAALVGLYQQEGYVRMRIVSVDTDWNEDGGITATIRIDEGKQYALRALTFRGNDHFLREELSGLLSNRVGRPVNYVGLERDQETLAEFYRNAGYLDAEVKGTLLFDEEGTSVEARFEIREGPRYHRGAVTVRGNLLTDSVVVLREVPMAEGAPAGEKELLSFQQAVFGTGLFKSVRLTRVKHPERGVVDLVVDVEETLYFEIEYGAGYGTDTGLRGLAGMTFRNLDGEGRRLSSKILLSQKEQNYYVDFREPWVLGNRWKWEGGLTGSFQEAERESFRIRKASAVAGITKTVFLRSSVAVQYEFSRDEVFDVTPGAVLSPEDQGTANISAFRGLFVFDFRDDPFHPKRGSFHSGSAELASSFFGSEVDYVKLTGQTSWYFPLFRRNTLALSGRAGVIRAMRNTIEVPIQKRFFLGGRTSVRGFKEDSLGPRGADGAPSGGDYMVNGNAEIRVPLKYGVIAALFLDAGSVWLGGDPDNGFDLRESAGVGLRYITPVGPVGIDYGWKLDRRDGESGSEWHFTIGAVF